MQIRMRSIEEIRQFSDSKCRQIQAVLKCADSGKMYEFLQFHGQFVECLSKPESLDIGIKGCDLPNALYWSVIDEKLLKIYKRTDKFYCCQHMLDID